ncbi:MAG: hypothetical protein H6700_06810 [Myxococcales bacterium]|nr:hypothetical protein [Myxococcales bacterium]MCB9531458.1 hypothetical protein [Myxococcales bacterium]
MKRSTLLLLLATLVGGCSGLQAAAPDATTSSPEECSGGACEDLHCTTFSTCDGT